jgi:cytochrome b6-f complex iron-sulfur subunit
MTFSSLYRDIIVATALFAPSMPLHAGHVRCTAALSSTEGCVADIEDRTASAFTRRTFCVQACGALSLTTIGAMLSGCGGSPTSPSSAPPLPTINASVANGVVSITIDSASPLANVGGAALVQTSSGMFLVARTGQSTFTALTAICTHEGCTVSGFENQTYVCPCHGSRYNTSGTVVNGPAPTALRSFPAQFNNNVLTITL